MVQLCACVEIIENHNLGNSGIVVEAYLAKNCTSYIALPLHYVDKVGIYVTRMYAWFIFPKMHACN